MWVAVYLLETFRSAFGDPFPQPYCQFFPVLPEWFREGLAMDRVQAGFFVATATSAIIFLAAIAWLMLM